MKATRWTLTILAALVLAGPALAGELGDKAPALNIKEWVKGKPVDVTKTDGKSVYVVEFWATWCGPCLASIPHVTEMQKKFAGKNVTFVGISDEDIDTVKKFVSKQGDKMDYTIAVDKDKATNKAYMGAFGITGIPNAFVIDQKGQIVWQGHPMANLEKVIEEVVAGKYDLAAAKKAGLARQYANEYAQLVQSAGKEEQAAELGRKVVENGKGDPMLLNDFAWTILTERRFVTRDLKLALAAAEAANKATEGKDAMTLDTYALALFENDKKQEAVKAQLEAVRLAKKDYADQKQMIAELEERLERFQNAVE